MGRAGEGGQRPCRQRVVSIAEMTTFLPAKAFEFAAEAQELLEATLPGNHVVKAVEQGTRFVIRPEGADLEPELVQLYADRKDLEKDPLKGLVKAEQERPAAGLCGLW
ncbi:hypothetical protein FsymDg_0150 [Candidatus Protofrankia datiscae]|uniref:Uncharacterized protein n=3 Tax=Candidatus Protofrankia datiscae TaxID=2716812 RepID=F8B0V7_9ACTN|nr:MULTISPECIES: hypothetical protein [Protofrankia]AEH07725.1 hypothetical protein FsymDg_0150 [Candidatus Protofrankia datiscae]